MATAEREAEATARTVDRREGIVNEYCLDEFRVLTGNLEIKMEFAKTGYAGLNHMVSIYKHLSLVYYDLEAFGGRTRYATSCLSGQRQIIDSQCKC